jgi:hypothetical protein
MTVFNIEQFGAAPDGTLSTEAIQKAIDSCQERGDVVEIPAGEFLTATLELRSGVTLRLTKGSTLKGSSDLSDYRDIGVVHNEWGPVLTLIFAKNAHDIAIEGEGTIDFNGSSFFDFERPYNSELDINRLTEQQRQEFEAHTAGRPNQSIFLLECRDVTIRGVKLLDSAAWGLCVDSCDNVRIADLTIRFSRRIPNSDGIHLVSCQNVIVSGCDIVSGDDSIAISGINNWTRESRNIVISDCHLSSSSAGIRVGYWYSKVKNVSIHNCTVTDSVRGITVMGCGSGYVSNLLVSGLAIETRGLAGTWWGMGEGVYLSGQHFEVRNHEGAGFDEEVREVNIENVTFRDVTMDVEFGPVLISDRPNIRDVRFINNRITVKNSPNRGFFGDSLDLNPGSLVRSIPDDTAYWLYAENVSGLSVTETRASSELNGKVNVAAHELRDCANVIFREVAEPHPSGPARG